MKKAFLLSGLFLSFYLAFAQTYVPFPDSNVYWNEIELYQGQCDPPEYCKSTYYLLGDTVIDSYSYKKIFSSDGSSHSYVGGLREENKRIYLYYTWCDHSVLLYDFNLNVGDTMITTCLAAECDIQENLYMTVVSVDSVLLNDQGYRRRINFNYGSQMSWIEGIGSVSGLLYPYYSCVLCVCSRELVCFEQDGNTLYLNEDLVPCFNYPVPSGNLDITSEWRVNSFVAEPGYMNQSYYRDFIDGDTTINSVEYWKVYNSGYTNLNGGPPYYFIHSLHGFLREENSKWYTNDMYGSQDALLFDFTLGISDTVHSAFTSTFNEEPVIVTAVDSILVGGEYKRRMHLNFEEYSGAEYIIEDIGATSGLFENMYFFEWGSELICFAKEGNSLWGASTEECDLAVNITENQRKNDLCIISPNPGKDFIMLLIPPGFGKVEFALIDLPGRIVYQNSFMSPSENKIKVNDFPSGIYLAIIKSNKSRQTAKLIIQ